MNLTPEETTKTKSMLLYMIEKLHKQSDGHSGFHPNKFEPILDDMVKDGSLEKRDTIHSNRYFLKTRPK